jgi:hypothetical protein
MQKSMRASGMVPVAFCLYQPPPELPLWYEPMSNMSTVSSGTWKCQCVHSHEHSGQELLLTGLTVPVPLVFGKL